MFITILSVLVGYLHALVVVSAVFTLLGVIVRSQKVIFLGAVGIAVGLPLSFIAKPQIIHSAAYIIGFILYFLHFAAKLYKRRHRILYHWENLKAAWSRL